MSEFKDKKDIAKRSKVMWASYLIDILTVVSLAVEPYLNLLSQYMPNWAYFIVLVLVSIIIKLVRVMSYGSKAKKSIARAIGRWANLKDTTTDDSQ